MISDAPEVGSREKEFSEVGSGGGMATIRTESCITL